MIYLKNCHLFLLILVTILISDCNTSLGGRSSPQNYKCGDFRAGHCYVTGSLGNIGPSGEHLTGFRSTISVVGNISPGQGFITNEFWLISSQETIGWIEVGYIVSAHELLHYFWAVLDPDTHIFTRHEIGAVPKGEIGTRVTFDIHEISEDNFVISIDGSITHFSTTTQVNLWDGNHGGHIDLGMELAGSNGAVSSFAEFVENKVYDNKISQLPRFANESDSPSESIGQPPYGGWLQKPAAGNYGGVFSTYCCAR